MARRTARAHYTIVREIATDSETIYRKIASASDLQRAVSYANGDFREYGPGTITITGTECTHLTGTFKNHVLKWTDTYAGKTMKAYDVRKTAQPWY